jgi:hypothetical protein
MTCRSWRSRRILCIASIALVGLFVACTSAQDQRPKDEPPPTPHDGGASSSPAPHLEPDKRPPLIDAALSTDGGECSARKVNERCNAAGIALEGIESECASRTREGLCGTTLFYDVDEHGCVSRVWSNAATEKMLSCFADILGSQRWPCVDKGQHSWDGRCALL